MKLTFQIFMLLFSISLLTFSCGKDDESDDNDAACEGIICENGGNCNNGDCACPDNFTGPSCETPVPVTSVKLNSVTIKSFPAGTVFGGGWDENNGKPDITFQILNPSGTVAYSHDEIITDALASNEYTLFASNFNFSSPDASYTLLLLDDDGNGSNETITEYQFIPKYTDGISGILELTGGSSRIDVFVTNNY